MKKWKDILYDFSDYIVAVILGMIVIFSFYNNINVFFVDIFGQNIAQSITEISEIEKSAQTDNIKKNEDTQVSEKEKNHIDSSQSTEAIQNEQKEVTINIPETAVSYDIVDILYENGLIKSKKDTLSYIEKNKLDTKLNSGSFTLSTNMSTEEIISTITIK